MTITRGNNYFRRRNPGNPIWTSGYDVCIEDEKGIKYFYQLRNYNCDRITMIDPIEIVGGQQLEWDELNVNIREAHFFTVNPKGTESEKNLFVYGEVEGAKINAENEWAETHKVYNREITLRLAKELGHFDKVESLDSVSRWVGTGYRSYRYVIDGKWHVTVSAKNHPGKKSYASYSIEDYTKIVAQQKVFGRRVAKLAQKADVPWNIGVFAGHIECDEEAVYILKNVKSARGIADESLQRELSSGLGRKTAAIELLLGDTWNKLNCRGQRQTTILANYLLGE